MLSREAGAPATAAAANLQNEGAAREAVGRLALSASVAALQASAPAAVADAFRRTRLEKPHGALYGAAPLDSATAELLLQRVLPET